MMGPRPVKRVGSAERTMIPLSPLMAGAATLLTGGMNIPLFVGGTAAGMAADATAVASRPLRQPLTLADGFESLATERRAPADATAVGPGVPRQGTQAMPGARLREIVHGPRPTNVEPAGGDFPAALRFVLRQEVPVQDRAHLGRAIQETGPEGDVGIDPIGQREFARRHPAMWQEMTERLTENTTRAFGDTPHERMQIRELPAVERRRDWSAWKAFNANAARSVYADIWNASGADRLSEPLATVHFDTAVQFGPGVARQLLRQSGGDAATYLDLREARYRALMTSPTADIPRGQFREAPVRQTGWLEQRVPALRALVRRYPEAGESR